VIVGPNDGPTSVLKYMDGGSLQAVLHWRGRGRGFPEPALAEVAARCLMGLVHLHSHGVTHLDVKPDNFLVNSQGEVKISDFNTCYFSPGSSPNAYAELHDAMVVDVWGLGLTVLELFLGRSPIVPDVEDPTHDDWKEEICNREPPTVPEYMEASPEL
jgi:mitogen-activated protein kinase kinase 9